MKKLMFAATVAISLAAAAEMKIGTVDMLKLVRNHSRYESNRTYLVETEKDYSKKIDDLKSGVRDIEDEARKLAEQLKNPMLAAEAKAKLEKQIKEIEKRYIDAQQSLRSEAMRCQQELQSAEARLMKTTAEEIRAEISKYADKNDYDLILDRQAALFAKEEFDVTPAILKAMGVDPDKAKAADK